ncbi:MAG: hypothetical protein WBD05_08805 [Phycisphaerae bacterium]
MSIRHLPDARAHLFVPTHETQHGPLAGAAGKLLTPAGVGLENTSAERSAAASPGGHAPTGTFQASGKESLMIRQARWVAAAIVLGFCLASAAVAQNYEIRLHRPVKVGQKYRMAASGRAMQEMTRTAGGRVVMNRTDAYSVEFEALATVLETDKNGRPAKLSLTVAKCDKVQGDATKSLVPKEAVIVASVPENGGQVFEIDGVPVGQKVHEALSLVITLSSGGATDDEVLGTEERKKVGDRWNVNAARLIEDLKKDGIVSRQEDIKGTVTLEQVIKVGETECLKIGGEMTINNFKPPGIKADEATLEMRFSGAFPLDTSLGRLEESTKQTLTLLHKQTGDPNDPEVVVKATMTRRAVIKITFLD